MAVPIILGAIAAGSALYGAYKGISGAIDHSSAKNIDTNAHSLVDSANRRVEAQRQATNNLLADYGSRKLRAFDGLIADFIQSFGQLKNVDAIHTPELDKLGIGDFSATSLQGLRDDYALLKSSGLGLGSGLGGGAALAFGAYNGTMLLATASTGTAISTLSGVAATNATLAWIGGGTIAAGGGGIALGTMVLGAVVIGPALGIFGHIVGSKGEEALNNARSNMDQARTIHTEAELMCGKLESIQKVTALANSTFSKVSSKLRHAVGEMKSGIDSNGTDYARYPDEVKAAVLAAVKFAQLLKAMIDTPILDKNGSLILSTEKKTREIGELAA